MKKKFKLPVDKILQDKLQQSLINGAGVLALKAGHVIAEKVKEKYNNPTDRTLVLRDVTKAIKNPSRYNRSQLMDLKIHISGFIEENEKKMKDFTWKKKIIPLYGQATLVKHKTEYSSLVNKESNLIQVIASRDYQELLNIYKTNSLHNEYFNNYKEFLKEYKEYMGKGKTAYFLASHKVSNDEDIQQEIMKFAEDKGNLNLIPEELERRVKQEEVKQELKLKDLK